MYRARLLFAAAIAAAAALTGVSCSDSSTGVGSTSSGTMVVQLTDAPFLTDSLRSVTIFVVRVDARTTDVDSAQADHDLSLDSASADGWVTVATPNAAFDLLALQNGITATLGEAALRAGTYDGFRLIIDPTRSSVTLKSGLVLTGTSTPSVTFPSASRSGIKVVLAQPVTIVGGTTTTLLVDFNVNDSFVIRGNSILHNGLLFKPVIHASITNTALTNATVRLVNATNAALDLLQNGSAVSGGSDLAFGASSACTSVNATTPGLSVTQVGSTTALAGFAPALTAGSSFTIVAFPTLTGGVQFATLANAFTPASGSAGLRVFNATGLTTGLDVFVTAPGAALGTATISNVLTGGSSAFVSIPAGTSQIRLAAVGGSTVLLDLGAQPITAGQNLTLVIAPAAPGSTQLRAFLVSGC